MSRMHTQVTASHPSLIALTLLRRFWRLSSSSSSYPHPRGTTVSFASVKQGDVSVNQKLHLHSVARTFSTTTALPNIDAQATYDESISGHSSVRGCLGQESDSDSLFHSLGMKKTDLYELAGQPPTPLKISDMYKYATGADKLQRLRNAQFVHREIPIRLAQRTVDLLTLPYGLSEAMHIQQVACAYIRKIHTLLSMPTPQTFVDEEHFTDMLQSLVLDRSHIPTAISQGLVSWSADRREIEVERLQEMEDALYRFFTAHVGLRLLIEHHVLSSSRESSKALRTTTSMFPEEEHDFPGCIHSNVDLVREISRVADLVIQQTKDFYGSSPEIEVVDCIDKRNTGDFTYIPNHLHYMMGELLKNSCRATVRAYGGDVANNNNHGCLALGTLSRAAMQTLPSLRVVVVKGDEDVTIKVADKGGGIPRSRISRIWKFAHSTADKEENSWDFGMDSLSGSKIRGFGLVRICCFSFA